MRETKDPDEVVRARLRAVLADEVRGEPGEGHGTSSPVRTPPATSPALPRGRVPGTRPIPAPWERQPEDLRWADDDWPPQDADPAAESGTDSASRVESSSPERLPSDRDGASVPGFPAWTFEPATPPDSAPPAGGTVGSVSLAGAFGSPESRARRLLPFDPGRRGVRALAAVVILVVLIAAALAWRARPRLDPVAAPPADPRPVAASDQPGPGGVGGSPSASEVVVAVGGKVRKPGLVHLAPGSRVADALAAAGGADPGVDVATLNLARKVIDGELIMVGVAAPAGAAPAAAAAGQPGGTPAGGPINLNTATIADLDSLPGVGPVLAQRILDARDAQGGFKSVSDLRKVDGIGDARYEQLKDLVIV